ncbi:hypothetical protein CC86DRAFT_400764 [Ophiobolus disseminans]|uniref:Uncharacterized protein n=1 Tax=Ophiobolus disseminans TaxID=1469910 RepID=A0A6A7AGE0_9PLEO|nr:hypothetical protein CC86DRAFT_400764 [Ophiobolus disseminans]
MKVMEKGTDRRAEVHISVDGQVDDIAEYGEYIDPVDKAICCDVPIEEDHKVKFGGWFSGTALTVAFDAVIDGVYRKANSYVAKSVTAQMNKKFEIENFLYRTDKGIIDTEMHVVPLSGVTMSRGEGPETVGTMELRLYVTRQIGVHHALSNIEKYSSNNGNIEDDVDVEETATYRQIEPTIKMSFERNCAPLEKRKVTREQRNMEMRRPGTESWAIFRFHYRSKDAIIKQNLVLTADPKDKNKTVSHVLDLEPVPPLPLGTKPQKDDGDSSTRATTPMPPYTPSPPVKTLQKEPNPKSPTLSTKQPAITTPTPTDTPASKTNMVSLTKKNTISSLETTPAPKTAEGVGEDLRARVFLKPSLKSAATTIDKAATNGDGKSAVSTPTTNGDTEKVAKTTTTPIVEKPTKAAPVPPINSEAAEEPIEKPTENPGEKPTEKPTEKPVGKSVGKAAATASDTIVVTLPKGKSNGFTSVNGPATKTTTPAKDPAKKIPQVVIPPAKKPIVKPTPVATATATAQKKPPVAAPPVTPTKRTAEPTIVTTPEVKRAKIVPAPIVPTTPATVSRIASGTPSPRPVSIDHKVVEQRKKLEALRLKRLENAKKQEQLDKQMEPFKKRMAEELERINREMMEEEAAAAEDEEHLKVSAQMLAEFEKGDGGE